MMDERMSPYALQDFVLFGAAVQNANFRPEGLEGTNRWMDVQMNGWTDGQTGGQTNGWMEGWTDGWMDRWMDKR